MVQISEPQVILESNSVSQSGWEMRGMKWRTLHDMASLVKFLISEWHFRLSHSAMEGFHQGKGWSQKQSSEGGGGERKQDRDSRSGGRGREENEGERCWDTTRDTASTCWTWSNLQGVLCLRHPLVTRCTKSLAVSFQFRQTMTPMTDKAWKIFFHKNLFLRYHVFTT